MSEQLDIIKDIMNKVDGLIEHVTETEDIKSLKNALDSLSDALNEAIETEKRVEQHITAALQEVDKLMNSDR